MYVVHDPQCHEVRGQKAISSREAVRQQPYARPHESCLLGGFAGDRVVLVEEPTPAHEYQESMIWPAGEPRSLCMVCRTTHPEELT